MKNFMRNLDKHSSQPELLVYGHSRIVTKFGVIMTLFTYIMIMVLGGFFFQEWLFNAKPEVVENNSVTYDKLINLTSFPIVINVMDNTLSPIKNSERIFGIEPIQGDSTAVADFSIFLVKCDIDKHFGEYKELFKNIPYLDSYYCLPAGAYNLSLIGAYGAPIELNINFDIVRCVNGTNYDFLGGLRTNVSNCYPPEQIKTLLNEVFINIFMIDYGINHNLPNPKEARIKQSTLPISSSLFKRYFLYYKFIDYRTDKGFMFKDEEEIFFHKFDYKDISVDLSLLTLKKFGQITIPLSGTLNTMMRTYPKIQQILANIGGVFSAVNLIASAIAKFFTKTLLYIEFANSYFNFDDKITKSSENSAFPLKILYKKNPLTRKEISSKSTSNNKLKTGFSSMFCPSKIQTTAIDIVKQKISITNILKELLLLENMIELILSPEQKELLRNPKPINFYEHLYFIEQQQIDNKVKHLRIDER